jgi:hypothetical protein
MSGSSWRLTRSLVVSAAIPVVLSACSDPSSTSPGSTTRDTTLPMPIARSGRGGATSRTSDTNVEQQLASLRALTAKFHRFEVAQAAGWSVPVPPCRDNPPQGGMGWHFVNVAYVDATVEVLKPEVVIYEPEKNGALRLVGIEYIIPFTILPSTANPPSLLGQQFVRNFGDQVWMLHVWVWRHNHDGMFASWNPSVSCRYAGAQP